MTRADKDKVRRLRIPAAAWPAIGRWLGQFGMFSILWLILMAVLPITWGWQPHAIISGSMHTAIHVGDIVVIDPGTPKNLKPGQVMTFTDPNHPDRVLTHRLVQKNDDGTWQTKGDANPTPDSAPIHERDIVGKPRILVPWLGMLSYWIHVGKTGYAVGAAVLIVILTWFGIAVLGAPADTARADPAHTPRHQRQRRRRSPFRR